MLTDYNHCYCKILHCKRVGPEGAGETVDDPSSEEERFTTEGESEEEEVADEADTPPKEPWCPPIRHLMIKGAADKLATMMNSSQPQTNVFFQLDNLGALPHLWLQAKLYLPDVHAGKVCPTFHVNCIRIVASGGDR